MRVWRAGARGGWFAVFALSCLLFHANASNADTQYRLQSYLDLFVDSPGRSVKEDPALWWNRLTVTNNSALTDSLAFEFRGFANITAPTSTHGLLSKPGAHTVAARVTDITALNLRARWGRFDLLAGKTGLNLGVADLYSPLSGLEPVNLNDPLHTFNMGLWQAGADFYLGNTSLTIRVIPFDERSRLPARRSRWNGPAGDLAIIDFSRVPTGLAPQGLNVREDFRRATPSHWGYLAALRTVGEGFDASAGAYYGPGLYPVIKARVTPQLNVSVLKQRPDALIGFSTITFAASQWKAYGELLLEHAPNRDDDDFVQGVAGVKYDSWYLANALEAESTAFTMEYTGDHSIRRMDDGPLRFSSKITRPFRNSVFMQFDLGATSDLSFFGKAAVNATSEDSAVWLGGRYRWSDDLSLHLQLQMFQGEANTTFGRWKSNDGLFFGLDYVL